MLGTHSKLRFILNLLPLIQNAKSLRRVVSVGAACCEGPINIDNIYGKGLPLMKWRDQNASIATLLMGKVAQRAPDVSFVHNVPGVVKSNITRDAEGFAMTMTIAISKLLGPFIQTSPSECAERQLFQATSARYPALQTEKRTVGVPFSGDIARGINGSVGSGLYSVDPKCESAPIKVETLIAAFKQDGTSERVWELFMTDFKRITGTEVAA